MTTALGPVIGGWLIDHFSWRWAFFLNLPIAAATLFLLFRYVPESGDPRAPRQLDGIGAVLATAGLGGLVYGLIESSRRGWDHPRGHGTHRRSRDSRCLRRCRGPQRGPCFPRSCSAPVACRRQPRDPGTVRSTGHGLLRPAPRSHTGAGLLRDRRGPATLPLIAILFLLSRWSGGLVDRVGARLPLVAGPVVAAVGFALLARPGVGGSYWTSFFPALLVLGLGMAVTVAPLTTTVMNAVDVAHAGIASGVNNAVSRAAGLMASAVMSVPLLHVFNDRLERRLTDLGLRTELVAEVLAQRMMLANVEVPRSAGPSERIAIRRAIAEAFVAGFRLVASTAAGLALASAATAALTIAGTPPPDPTR